MFYQWIITILFIYKFFYSVMYWVQNIIFLYKRFLFVTMSFLCYNLIQHKVE